MKRDEEMLDLFIKSIEENNILSISGDNPYRVETNIKAFYIYLKKIESAHLPGKPDVSRIQIPQSTKFDCIIQSNLTFFAIGYDFANRVYVIWNPEKVKQRLNQSKNFSIYSTFTYQHSVRVRQKAYHYKSKQIQDAMIVLPEELKDVLINSNSYFECEESPKSNPKESIDWEGMFTNAAGKLTALANPVLLEKLKGCLLQPYPSIPYACIIIVDFYGVDRFPNMELSDWLDVINKINWDLPEQILAEQQTQQIEKPTENVETNLSVNQPIAPNTYSDEEMILALDLLSKLLSGEVEDIAQEISFLAKIIGSSPSNIAKCLLNYEYIKTGKGLSDGVEQCVPIWHKYVKNNLGNLKKDVKDILLKYQDVVPDEDLTMVKDSSSHKYIGVDIYRKRNLLADTPNANTIELGTAEEVNSHTNKISVENSSCKVNINSLNVTSDNNLRKKNSVLRVIRDNGSIIEKSTAAITMGEAIKELGVVSVKNLGITHDGMNLIQVGGNSKYPGQQYDLGLNLYLNTHSSTERKKRQLEKIFNMLRVNWTVEIV